MKSVYVGNLPYATTEDELRKMFADFGQVLGARIKTDRDTGRPLGYGFVQMDDADADKAIEELNGKEIEGRPLRVNESREKVGDSPAGRFGDRPPRRDFQPRENRFGDRGDRPPRRDFQPRENRFGDRPRDFQPRENRFGDRPRDFQPRENRFNHDFQPRRSFDNDMSNTYNPADDDFDMDYNDDGNTSSFSHDFGGDDRPRRRSFQKQNRPRRDFRDTDRPRRPFMKQEGRKRKYRPNDDFDQED